MNHFILDMLENLKYSDSIAIKNREVIITYRELWEKSEALAYYIKERCKTKAPIVIYGIK